MYCKTNGAVNRHLIISFVCKGKTCKLMFFCNIRWVQGDQSSVTFNFSAPPQRNIRELLQKKKKKTSDHTQTHNICRKQTHTRSQDALWVTTIRNQWCSIKCWFDVTTYKKHVRLEAECENVNRCIHSFLSFGSRFARTSSLTPRAHREKTVNLAIHLHREMLRVTHIWCSVTFLLYVFTVCVYNACLDRCPLQLSTV